MLAHRNVLLRQPALSDNGRQRQRSENEPAACRSEVDTKPAGGAVYERDRCLAEAGETGR